MKAIKSVFFMLALLACNSDSFAGLEVTGPGTYFYNADEDNGGCFLSGKCYTLVITPDNVTTGSVVGDYHIETTGEPFELIIHDGATDYVYQVTSLDQVLNDDGSRSFTYELAE